MRRRQVLASVPLALTAGCLGRSGGADSREVTLGETTFELVERGCGNEVETASVSVDSDAALVSVSGTTSGANTCYRARIANSSYDEGADEFELVMEAYDANDGACAECVTELDYEATADFEGGLPGSVVVVHDSRGTRRTVATASP
jgi:hypothetical protein